MKKILIWMIAILIVAGLTGCGNRENMSDFISLTSKITELESGLSVVKFDGDYAFALFLEQGGAESDQDVFRFISQSLLSANVDLQMQAEGFGCSTISIQNTDKADITTTTAIRMMLDQAATTDEALELLRQYDLHASMNKEEIKDILDSVSKDNFNEFEERDCSKASMKIRRIWSSWKI